MTRSIPEVQLQSKSNPEQTSRLELPHDSKSVAATKACLGVVKFKILKGHESFIFEFAFRRSKAEESLEKQLYTAMERGA